MCGINLTIVLLLASVVAMCTSNRLPDKPQTALSGISNPDADIMAKMLNMEASYDVKLRNVEARYDGIIKEMKNTQMKMTKNYDEKIKELIEHYDGEKQEMKKHYDGEILELKHVQTRALTSHEVTIKKLNERHDEMTSSLEEMKSSLAEIKSSQNEMKSGHDVEILALKESYNVMRKTNEGLKIKFNQIRKAFVSKEDRKEIEAQINQADVVLYPNNILRDHVNNSRNKSELMADAQTEISLEQKSDPSIDSAKGGNNKHKPAPIINTESEKLAQLLDVSRHHLIDLGGDGFDTGHGKAAGFSAFQAYIPGSYTGSQDETLVYDDVRINIGGAYRSATGHFIAPTVGVYVINRSHMADGSCGTIHACIRLMINGVFKSKTCSVYPTSTAKAELIQLVAGDDVWLEVDGTCTSFQENHHSSFSGYLLIENI